MSDETLERYIRQYIEASAGPEISFVWHGGEPTLAGLDFYRRAVELQKRYLPDGWTCRNNIQTNGLLLDDAWCAFIAEADFDVGLSIDGAQWLHDRYRKDHGGHGSYERAANAIRRLQAHGVQADLLCTVTAAAAEEPREIYRALRNLGTGWIQFIPIVRRVTDEAATPRSDAQSDAKLKVGKPDGSKSDGNNTGSNAPNNGVRSTNAPNIGSPDGGAPLSTTASTSAPNSSTSYAVTPESVSGEGYGRFLCAVFDEWSLHDLGKLDVQFFAETARVLDGGSPGLCWMAPTCGRVVIVEQDGGVYACDHFVAPSYKIGDIYAAHLGELVDAPAQVRFGESKRDGLPAVCHACPWLNACNGGCPKDRFVPAEDGGAPENHLCEGLRHFFTHAEPALAQIVGRTRQGQEPGAIMAALREQAKTAWKGVGRNDPCPCGSGKKAKQCCWDAHP